MKSLKLFSCFVLIIAILALCSCSHPSGKEPPLEKMLTELGAPSQEYYTYNYVARCVWDMEIADNRLYIGCGDYGKNSGATPLLYYDLESESWQRETVLYDEQIGRFLWVDGKLTIPGFDPVGAPEYGTYYQKAEDTWETISGLPDGQHNYDVIRFENKLFFGIGAQRGLTPIVYTEDNVNYVRVPMFRDGKEINTDGGECIRTHNFYVLEDTLYAEFWYENMAENRLVSEIYKYEGGKFVFHSELVGKLNTGSSCSNLPPVYGKENFGDSIFITTGFLYYTKDLDAFTKIDLPNYARTYDMYLFDDKLYLLTASQTEQDYDIIVYSTTSEDFKDFKVEYSFRAPVHPTALAVNEDSIFIALGKWWNQGSEENGRVVRIQG